MISLYNRMVTNIIGNADQMNQWIIENNKIAIDLNNESNQSFIKSIEEASEFVARTINKPALYRGKKALVANESIRTDYPKKQDRQMKLGLLGEKIIYDSLNKNGVKNLEHVSAQGRDFEGYDISFERDGVMHYVEVKATVRGETEPFYMSVNEFEFYQAHKENYYIYRLCNLDSKKKTYDIYYLDGNDLADYNFKSIQFEVSK